MAAYLLDTNHASPLVTLSHPLRERVQIVTLPLFHNYEQRIGSNFFTTTQNFYHRHLLHCTHRQPRHQLALRHPAGD